eukprot:m.167184 g.167184  ORF g.167184 m.167184 type:complete len:51 (-) comp16450_c2_seq1:1559-1711(-)
MRSNNLFSEVRSCLSDAVQSCDEWDISEFFELRRSADSSDVAVNDIVESR